MPTRQSILNNNLTGYQMINSMLKNIKYHESNEALLQSYFCRAVVIVPKQIVFFHLIYTHQIQLALLTLLQLPPLPPISISAPGRGTSMVRDIPLARHTTEYNDDIKRT